MKTEQNISQAVYEIIDEAITIERLKDIAWPFVIANKDRAKAEAIRVYILKRFDELRDNK
jgi:hypothetical protein